MKFLECPYCHKYTFGLWRIFIFPPLFSWAPTCGYCKQISRFNWLFYESLLLSIGIGIILGFILDFFIKIESAIFETAFMAFFALLPCLLRIPVFKKCEANNHPMNQTGL